MGASAARSPASPDEPARGLRASDAERDEVAARLTAEFVAGRLSHETFISRMDAVLQARRQADLPPLVADLPGPSESAPPRQYESAPPRQCQVAPAAAPYPLVSRIREALSWVRGQAGRDPRPGHGGWPGGDADPREPLADPRSIPARTASAEGGAVRGTMGMRVSGTERSPLSLQFPRGAAGEFSIGRDASCDLAIADMTVSRRHATLERTPDGWLISDLESTNGTRVNGWRVRGKVTVRAGDLISFGTLEAVFAREDTIFAREDTRPEAVPPADAAAPGIP